MYIYVYTYLISPMNGLADCRWITGDIIGGGPTLEVGCLLGEGM